MRLPASIGQTLNPEATTANALLSLPRIFGLMLGRLLVCWYSGTTEANEDTNILCSDSLDGDTTWGLPTRAVGPGERAIGAVEANKSLGNVALYLDIAGRLWMIHGVIQRWWALWCRFTARPGRPPMSAPSTSQRFGHASAPPAACWKFPAMT